MNDDTDNVTSIDGGAVVHVVTPKSDSLPVLDDNDFEALNRERDFTGENEQQQSQRIFQENAGAAAKTIVNLARFSKSDRIRMQASQYVVERILGRVQDNPPKLEDDPYKQLVDAVVRQVEVLDSTDGEQPNG